MKYNTLYSLLGLFVLSLLSSCQATEAYRRAQTAFSQGAAVEMTERFADAADQLPSNFVYFNDLYQSNTPADPDRSADGYYEDAMGEVASALKGKGQLEKNFALDNAYAIQALSMWRLEMYDQAKNVARIAVPLLEKNEGDESDIRDLAMMQALPGLINIDQSFDALQQIQRLGTELAESSDEATRQSKYQEIKGLFTSHYLSEADGAPSVSRGLALIERAIDNIEGQSAISMYLRNAQMAGVDNWGDAFQVVFLSARRLNDSPDELQWVVDGRDQYTELLRNYLKKLETALPGGKEDKLYKYWVRLLGGDV